MAKYFDSIKIRPITGNSRVNQQFPDPANYTVSPGTQITPSSAISTPDLQLLDQPTLAMQVRAHLAQVATLPPIDLTRRIDKRLMPGLALTMSKPAFINGRPQSPKFWGDNVNGLTYNLDRSPGHTQAGSDPNPIWNSATSSWIVAPPPGIGGVGTYRWHVQNFPQPSQYGGEIPIGARTSLDGSANMPTNANQWPTDPATPNGPGWQANYPYKPRLVSYNHVNQDGSTVFFERGLLFNRHYAQHMHAFFPSNQNFPYTWLVVGILLGNTYGAQTNYIIDGGYAPSTWVTGLTEDNISLNRNFTGDYENLMNRPRMFADKSRVHIGAGRSGGTINSLRYNSLKPQMLYGMWNNTQSYVGSRTTGVWKQTKGKTFNTTGYPWRRALLGRANGYMGVSYGLDMLVFEIRYWNRVLTGAELAGQFNQLSTTWQFAKFK